MNIHLPLYEADRLVDIALSKQSNLVIKRREYKKLAKIVYTLKFRGKYSSEWRVLLHSLDNTHTKFTYPISLPNSKAFPSPHSPGGSLIVTVGPDAKEDLKKTPVYKLCNSINTTVTKQEYLRRGDIKKMEEDNDLYPLKPGRGSSLHNWFKYKVRVEKLDLKYSLKQLAEDSSINYGHVRNEFPRWKREHMD